MGVVTGGDGISGATPSRHARDRRTWWCAFVLLAVAGGSWALSLPVLTGPDEAAHGIRAAAVARREFVGSAGRPFLWAENILVTVQVPEAYANASVVGSCFLGRVSGPTLPELLDQPELPRIPPPPTCPEFEGGGRTVPALTYEQRGQPLYYGVAGLPSLRWTGEGGVILGRLLGAVVCAAALASGLVSALRLARPRLAVVAVAVATTPAVLYLAGVVNSAGVENAFALSAWVSGLALVRGAAPDIDRRLVVRTAAALALLAMTRGFSPLYVLVIGAVLIAVARPGRVRALLARTDVRVGIAAVGVGGLASALWLWHIDGRLPLPDRAGTGWATASGELWWFTRHAVAVFGSNDVVPPVALHIAWVAVALGVVAVGLRRARRRHVATLVGLLVFIELLQVSAEGLSFPPTGFWWQGRYVLPLLLGVPLAAAAVFGADDGSTADPRREEDARLRRLGPPTLVLLVALQAWAFLYAARHYAVGFDGPASPLEYLTDPDWSSPYGPAWLLALTFTGALAALAALAWRAANDAAAADPVAAQIPDADADAAGAGGGRSGPDHHDRAQVPRPEQAVRA